MSKLEYLNPGDWSLHVIDGENECVPEGWVLVPEGAEVYSEFADRKIFLKFNKEIVFGYIKDVFEILPIWSKKEIVVDRKSRILWSRKMKEYLVERDGKYELVEAYHLDGGILIDDKTDYLVKFANDLIQVRKEDITKVKSSKLFQRVLWQRNPSLKDQERIETASGYGLDRIGNNIYGTRSRYEGESDSSYRNYLMNFGKPKPLLNDKYTEIEEVRQDSNVSNPKHYTSHPSGIECIEITRHHDFSIGNAIKYLWRAGLKDSDNEIQDLEKAAWYIQDKIKQLRGGK